MTTSKTKVLSEQQLIDAGYTRHSGVSKVDGKTRVNSLWTRIDRANNKFDIANTAGLEISLDIHEASVMFGQLSSDDFAKV